MRNSPLSILHLRVPHTDEFQHPIQSQSANPAWQGQEITGEQSYEATGPSSMFGGREQVRSTRDTEYCTNSINSSRGCDL